MGTGSRFHQVGLLQRLTGGYVVEVSMVLPLSNKGLFRGWLLGGSIWRTQGWTPMAWSLAVGTCCQLHCSYCSCERGRFSKAQWDEVAMPVLPALWQEDSKMECNVAKFCLKKQTV
jgi:hypothetical protein